MKKTVFALVMIAVMALSMAFTAYAASGSWKQSAKGWWYEYSDGTYAANKWEKIGSKWYFFDNNGYMKTGWVKSGSKWYYLAESGAMQTGWVKSGSKWYYLAESGTMQTGWVKLSGRWYYLDHSGVMQTGWLAQGNKLYYLQSNGVMATGWQKMKGGESVQADGTHVFSPDGWCYFGNDGASITGWLKDQGKWYYLSEYPVFVGNGRMQAPYAGLMVQDNVGGPRVGEINSNQYVFDKNGVWVSKPGWYHSSNQFDSWYYVNQDGTAKTGWLKENGKRYYLFPHMAKGGQVIDNKVYLFGTNGVLAEKAGWNKQGTNRFYINKDGACRTGWQTIDGKKYYFIDPGKIPNWKSLLTTDRQFLTAGAMAYNIILTIDGKAYTFDANGQY